MHPQAEKARILSRNIEVGVGPSEKAGKIKNFEGDPWKEVGSQKAEDYDENDESNVIGGSGNGCGRGGGSVAAREC